MERAAGVREPARAWSTALSTTRQMSVAGTLFKDLASTTPAAKVSKDQVDAAQRRPTCFLPPAPMPDQARAPSLAPELWLQVVLHVDALSAVALLRTCRQLYDLVRSDEYWRRRYEKDFPFNSLKEMDLPELLGRSAP